jgi:general secretion pathway protein K
MRSSNEGGFALLAVMLVLALLGIIAVEFAFSMRLEATMVRSFKEEIIGAHLAEAAVQQAIREILTDSTIQGLVEERESEGKGPLLTFFKSPTQPLPRLPRSLVPLGGGRFSYRISDEEARINLNLSPPEIIDRLLLLLGVEKRERDVINDSLQDWKDTNELHRLNGAESEDTYLKLPVPYRSRNGNLEAVEELLQVKGVTPAIFYGSSGAPGLMEFVTVAGSGQVNINTASETALKALGLSEAEVTEIIQSRALAPYAAVPARFAGRRLSAATKTYRLEAEGGTGESLRYRVIAVVQKKAGVGGEASAVILSWNPAPLSGQ